MIGGAETADDPRRDTDTRRGQIGNTVEQNLVEHFVHPSRTLVPLGPRLTENLSFVDALLKAARPASKVEAPGTLTLFS